MTAKSSDPAPSAAESAKARFKEALDRKNAAAHHTSEGGSSTGPVHGSETMGEIRRTFRRRSGPS